MSVGKLPAPNLSRVTESFSNLEPSISALAFISAFTIVPSTMLALATVMSVGNAPAPNLVRGTESFNNLLPCISAVALISASIIFPAVRLAWVILMSVGSFLTLVYLRLQSH